MIKALELSVAPFIPVAFTRVITSNRKMIRWVVLLCILAVVECMRFGQRYQNNNRLILALALIYLVSGVGMGMLLGMNRSFFQLIEQERKKEPRILFVSVGYALFDPHENDLESVLEEADQMMYRVKKMHKQK